MYLSKNKAEKLANKYKNSRILRDFSSTDTVVPKLIEIKDIKKGQLVYTEDSLGFLEEFKCIQPAKGSNGVVQLKLINTDFPDGGQYIGKTYEFTDENAEFVDAPFKYDAKSDKFKAYSPKWI